MPPIAKQCFPYRPHDYIYDPIFSVSGPTDHYKAALVAKMSAAKFQICPIFPNMFSDLPNYPSVQLVKRRQKPPPTYAEMQKAKENHQADLAMYRQPDVSGADRSKFVCTVVNFPPKEELPYKAFPTFKIEKVAKRVKITTSKTRDVEVETKFRESTVQTDPWEPPYKVIGKGDPEILKLDFLKWGSGLPAGMHEVTLIERARMKSAWEKDINPEEGDVRSLEQFRDFIGVLAMDEWAFREKEISEIQELRLQLLENMLNEIHDLSNTRAQIKMSALIAKKEAEKEEELAKLKRKTDRELRKLETQRRGLCNKYHELNVIDEHMDRKSEIYAPLMRHGEHPKRWHLVIDEKMKQHRAQFIGVENISTLPKWLDQATKIDRRTMYANWPKRRLCIRETRWTAPVLKYLHKELRDLRKVAEKRPLTLRTRIETQDKEAHTPVVEGVTDEYEDLYQAVVTLQKIIKGRASQMLIYEGRDTCKELIQELKHSKGLLEKQKERKRKEKFRMKAQQREEIIQMNMVENLQGSLGKLQGKVVGSLLDFLNKELRRLLEERKAHAMCLINERERYIREAVEAGRRQKELRRRREHDEIFKQITKFTQENVDVYLKDIITDGMDFASKEEASKYVEKLARQIDRESDEKFEKYKSVDEQDEMISNLVLHYLLPDVQKKIIREKITTYQKFHLKSIHESIYTEIEELPAPRPPDLTTEEIVAQLLEEITQNVEALVEYGIGADQVSILTGADQVSLVTGTDADQISFVLQDDQSFRDPTELYMSQLMRLEDYDEGGGSFEMSHFHDYDEFNFKNETLATIPEVDNESSVKD